MNGSDSVGARFQDWRTLERARRIECVYQKVFLFTMHEKVTFGFAKHFLSATWNSLPVRYKIFEKKKIKGYMHSIWHARPSARQSWKRAPTISSPLID